MKSKTGQAPDMKTNPMKERDIKWFTSSKPLSRWVEKCPSKAWKRVGTERFSKMIASCYCEAVMLLTNYVAFSDSRRRWCDLALNESELRGSLELVEFYYCDVLKATDSYAGEREGQALLAKTITTPSACANQHWPADFYFRWVTKPEGVSVEQVERVASNLASAFRVRLMTMTEFRLWNRTRLRTTWYPTWVLQAAAQLCEQVRAQDPSVLYARAMENRR